MPIFFERALQATLRYEGGYVNDPRDPGGETYKGISRRAHPNWEGWKRIDTYKEGTGFPVMLDEDAGLQAMVRRFYDIHYWKPVGGPQYASQELANEMFDLAVHTGVQRAVLFLQRALNALNREATLYSNITEDGLFGRQTSRALQAYQQNDSLGPLHTLIVIQRGSHYLDITRKREQSEAFIRGWLRRVVLR